MRFPLLLALPFITAAAPPRAVAPLVPVVLTDYRFTPASLRVTHGQPIVLRLANDSDRGHNFVA